MAHANFSASHLTVWRRKTSIQCHDITRGKINRQQCTAAVAVAAQACLIGHVRIVALMQQGNVGKLRCVQKPTRRSGGTGNIHGRIVHVATVVAVVAAAVAAATSSSHNAVPSTMDDRLSENQYAPSEATEDDALSQGMNSTANHSQTAYGNDSSHYYGNRYGGGGRGRGGGWHDRSTGAAPPLPPPPSSVQAPPPFRGGRGGVGGRFGGGRYGGRGGRGGPGGGGPPPMTPYGQPHPGAYGQTYPGAYGQPPMPPYAQVSAAPTPPPYGQPQTDDGTAGSGSDHYARKRPRDGDPRDPRRRR